MVNADEVVLRCHIERDASSLYYLDRDGIWRLSAEAGGGDDDKPELVLVHSLELERGYVYYLDNDGDVRRHAQARVQRKMRQPPSVSTPVGPLPEELLRRIHDSPNYDPAKGIRTLSVRQPWAWAILHGGKNIENRSKRTKVRGTIAIHASMTPPEPDDLDDVRVVADVPVPEDLPLGAIVGLVEIVYCVDRGSPPWAVYGQRHWKLANPAAFPEPRPAGGAVGFWYWRPG
jgi:hypothetical protein